MQASTKSLSVKRSQVRSFSWRSRRAAALTALSVSVAALTGCATGEGVGSDPNNPNQVEVITWWNSGAERTALFDLVNVFKRDNPDIQFIDSSVSGAGGANARKAIAARLEADNPPDSFQASAGAALTDYVQAGKLQDLTAFYADNDLTGNYRPALLELLTVDGRIYSVPSDIRRVNVMWSNNRLLENAGIDPSVAPANLEAWLADLDRVRSSGVEYPLALGNELTQLQLFENVLIADLGAEMYQNLWRSADGWESDRLRSAVDHYARILDFVDPNGQSKDWSETTETVISGRSAYVVVADYAMSLFERAGYSDANLYSAAPMPGTVGTFNVLVDSFALPVGTVHEDAAKAWLLTISSPEGQKALNLALGSISPRMDAVATDFSPYQQTALASLLLDTPVPSLAHGVAAPPRWTDLIADAVVAFRRDGRAEALINALVEEAHAALG
jgi:glucose/mannose transport system substrate-binding protein